MKKTIVYTFMGLGLLLGSCGGNKGASDEVKDYAIYFVEKIKANQLDSLNSSFPEILKADSLVDLSRVTPEGISVTETGPGFFDIQLSPDTKLTVKRSEEGRIQVMESHGVFAFPSEKMEFARNTGMLADSVSDITLQERIADEAFVEWLKDKTFENAGGSVTLTPGKKSVKWRMDAECAVVTMPVTLTNNGSSPVSGANYKILYTEEYETCSDGSSPNGFSQHSQKGVDLGPGESKSVTLRLPCAINIRNPRIQFSATKESYFKDNFKPTGHEYQEYQSAKSIQK